MGERSIELLARLRVHTRSILRRGIGLNRRLACPGPQPGSHRPRPRANHLVDGESGLPAATSTWDRDRRSARRSPARRDGLNHARWPGGGRLADRAMHAPDRTAASASARSVGWVEWR
jgi:hypothetical protein